MHVRKILPCPEENLGRNTNLDIYLDALRYLAQEISQQSVKD